MTTEVEEAARARPRPRDPGQAAPDETCPRNAARAGVVCNMYRAWPDGWRRGRPPRGRRSGTPSSRPQREALRIGRAGDAAVRGGAAREATRPTHAQYVRETARA